MKIIDTVDEYLQIRKNINNSIGFVPTMGNLHKGHFSLCKRSKNENDITVVSIFVNPAQFNDPKDFQKYPRTLEADLKALEALEVDYCFIPDEKLLYPDNYTYKLSFATDNPIMEDLKRPQHFTGVLTIVLKLFNIIRPKNAYFGSKDYQQLLYIKNMVQALFLPINICACDTIREESGLALSSRNNLLGTKALELANTFAKIFHQKSLSLTEIRAQLLEYSLQIDYLEEHYGRRFIALYIEGVRLIDNYSI